jgi:hypothetical protein
MGREIGYTSDQMDSLAQNCGKLATSTGEAGGSAGTSFDGLETFFGSGAGEISNQLNAIQGSFSNVQGIVQRQSSEMFNMDIALSNVADSIDIPMDFVSNDQSRFTQYNNEILEKLDGKSVNDGNETNVNENLDGSGIKEEKKMGDITSDLVAAEEMYDDGSVIGKEQDMANVNNAGGQDEQNYDANSGIDDQEALKDITKATGAEEQEYDANSLINGQQGMRDMTNGGGTQEQALDASSLINGQEGLKDINKGGNLSPEELRERSRINAKAALDSLAGGQDGLEGHGLKNAAGALKGLEGIKGDFANGTKGITAEEARSQISGAAEARAMSVPSLAGISPVDIERGFTASEEEKKDAEASEEN